MGKKIFLAATIAVFVCSAVIVSRVSAEESDHDGQIVKMEGLDTLYYVAEGKRYVFPNEKTYKSWFTDFNDVAVLAPSEIYALPLAGNIRYRPGVLMVKITTDPKVYAVTKNGVLRWVKTEALAKKLYGNAWNMLIDDVPDSFFTNYTVGDPIANISDYDVNEELEGAPSIHANRGLAIARAKQAMTARCRAIPAVPNRHGPGATPAVPARECRVLGENEEEPEEVDTTPPIISEIAVELSTSTAVVSWITDEAAKSEVRFALESLAEAAEADIMSMASDELATEHSFELTGLTPETLYYFQVISTDAADNTAQSEEDAFTTLSENEEEEEEEEEETEE